MTRDDAGWWRVEVADAGPGTDYAFLLDDDPTPLPDPRSRWQPGGVHGAVPASTTRTRSHWTDQAWTGRQLPGSVLYELHIGTFTPDGTFDAAIERLDHLVELGIDLVEVLPVNAVDGPRNWGYDGVGWYAVTENYGGPDAFKRFVDACHARGPRRVLLDVVYNHLGPSGAYLDRFGPYFAGSNIWGPSLNLDGAGVRRGAPVRDRQRADVAARLPRRRAAAGRGARAARHPGRRTCWRSWPSRWRRCRRTSGRPLTLIAESDLNDPRLVTAREAGGYGLHAQWDDDIHHQPARRAHRRARRATTPTSPRRPDRARARCSPGVPPRGHVLELPAAQPRPPGATPTASPGHRFLAYLQNHDQIGNRATGDRLSATLSPGLLACGAALLLCSPFTPMLFMGEEWGARTPWQFFSYFPDADLRERGPGGPHRGVRRARVGLRSTRCRCPRPERRDHVPGLQAGLGRAGQEPHATLLHLHTGS